MGSQLGSSRLTVYYRRFYDGRPRSEGECLLPSAAGDTEDALTVTWPVAGGNRRVWNEADAAAGSDVGESQETVGELGLERRVT